MWQRVAETGRALARGLVELLYPSACFLCGRPPEETAAGTTVETGAFCLSCRSALTSDPRPACPRCAGNVGPFSHLANGCSACRNVSFGFDAALRLGPYPGPLREVILRMKHRSGETLAELMGELWAEHAKSALQSFSADVILPVPLHWRRRFWRGYNQAAALAHGLGDRLRVPVLVSCLRRIRHTPQQRQRSFSARQANVKDAFHAWPGPALRGRTVLLVDDVMTTGSTASEAARALRKAGAARVFVAALARAGLA